MTFVYQGLLSCIVGKANILNPIRLERKWNGILILMCFNGTFIRIGYSNFFFWSEDYM